MKVKELLASPDKWCKGASSRDRNGNARSVNDIDACQWCISGALEKCYCLRSEEFLEARSKIYDKLGLDLNELRLSLARGYIDWNDAPERTHAEVLALVTELDI